MKLVLSLLSLLLFIVVISCSKTSSSTEPTTPSQSNTALTIAGFAPASATAGMEVTINGTGFGTDINAVAVTFGSASGIKPKSVSATQIVVIVPASAKTGKIGVSINNGTVVYSNDIFTLTEDPNAYTVKTVGITRIRYVMTDNKLTLAELFGGGNKVIIKAGNDYSMEFVNAKNTVPDVDQYPDAFPNAFYNSPNAVIDNANPPDTNGVVIKLKGFKKSITGYDQLNLVMCYDKKLSADYNFIMITHFGPLLDRPQYNDSFFRQLFSTKVNVTHVELAPPQSLGPYIIRDMIVPGAVLILDSTLDHTIRIDASEIYYFQTRFNLDPRGKIDVGGQIKTELVNAEKGTISFPFPSFIKFSNIKKGGFGQIVEPADTIDKVFIRMTGFSPAICGFNQLRLFPTDDGSYGAGSMGYYNDLPASIMTLPFIQRTYKTDNLNCIELVIR